MSAYNYKKIEEYWNEVFQSAPKFTVDTKLPYPELNDGLRWLGENADNVLDFGCGNGKALIVASRMGITSGLGIDLSQNGVDRARSVVEGTPLSERLRFEKGGLEALEELESESFDGAMLLNILDNLHPEDGKALIKELGRILKKGAAVLLKLNPVYEKSVFEDDSFSQVTDACFEEESGLLFWNMDEEILNELLAEQFEYVNGYDVDMAEFETVNRLYWLKRV